ncbi:translation initiation factor III [Actinoplanes sp. CA-142083]|uniref:ferric reductase-like transmembrane domain-containing protein n=1 Tax=Actinoplanes sp. CA-142083 TaxID=3239903 RepID=UPI003D8D637B
MDVGATGTKPASKGAVLILIVSVLAAIWAVAMMTAPGRVGYIYFFMYAEFYMGVITLVALSVTIMVGLVSTDRLVLSIRQRVLLQSTHRTTGLIAVTSLFIHVWTKIAESHIKVIDIFVPFLSQGNRLYVGFGTLSGWIMIMVMWTGIARSRFIGNGRPWMWRAIHSISYLMWPIALVHGLAAGRAAKPWVIVSYIICILAVLVGLAVRLSVSLNRNKDFSSTAGASAMKPVGNMVPTSSPAMKKPRRREPEPEPQVLGPVAVVDTFQPAALPPPPREHREEMVAPAGPPRQRRGGFEDEIEYDEPGPRGRRYPGEDTSTRMRRPDLEDTSTRMRRPDFEDTSSRMRRPDLEDTSTRMRRVEMDDTSTRMRRVEMDDTSTRMRRIEADDFDEPAQPRRRRAAGNEPMPMYDDAPRGRRRAEPDYDDVPRQRGGRYEDDRRSSRYEPRFSDEVEDAPRARRDRGADIDRADSGRHTRSGFVDLADDETPTLVDMASRRQRRHEQDQEPAGRGARRGGRGRGNDDVADDDYWSQLRGEAN